MAGAKALTDRRANLDPERRALLERWKRGEFGEQAGLPTIPRRPRHASPPLSFAQQRLWFLDRLSMGSPVYNMPLQLRLRGPLDVAALERAFNEVVRRHEVLRTTFTAAGHQPAQVIAPSMALTIDVVDVAGVSAGEREAEAGRRALEEAGRPFDLARGPMIRVALIRLSPEDHVLLIAVHHIAFDGLSVSVLARELAALYGAFRAGLESPLSELPIQYADYAAWQREWFDGGALDEQVAYWKGRLAGLPTLELPCDRPRPPVQTFRGGSLGRIVPPGALDDVRAVSRREGVTLFMMLVAALATLLCRWSGQDDIVIGLANANRNRPEIEPLIGFFVNMLVLRIDISGDPTFGELLRRVREATLGAYANQDVPFERLVDALRPGRDLSRSPLFQFALTLMAASAQAVDLPGLGATEMHVPLGVAKFDIGLNLVEGRRGLVAVAEYASDLFDAATVERLLGHYQNVLRAAAADSGRRVSQLELLGPEERRLVTVEWNQTRRRYPSGCVHELFAEQAARAPDATALVWGAQRVAYRELDRRSSQLARYLRRLGVGPETLVGVATARTPDMVVALLGVLKAGGAYVALDPAYPRERLAFIAHDARLAAVLSEERLAGRLPALGALGARVVLLDADWPAIAAEDEGEPPAGALPGNLAYVIYTSGSTGRPKGVAVEHRSAVAFIHWARDAFSPEELAGVLASTSICFDLSVFELFVPLSRGGAAILADNVLQLPGLAAAREVTLINTVPSAMAELARIGGIPPGARTVNLGGEAAPAQLVEELYRRGPVQRVYNLYGPSEDTTYSTWALARRGSPRAPVIGRPIAGKQAYILDRHGEPVPVGVPGEIYIGGAGLARGYLGRPDLTAASFVPDPFGGEAGDRAGARLYRTGDLARRLPDGDIDFLGRLDHQVKVRGFRIELGEVEAALASCPAVREVVAAAREDIPGDRRLVAYVVLAAGGPKAAPAPADPAAGLRAFLRDRLPEYMVPSSFVFLDQLPLTLTGKVDRRALPAPDASLGRPAGPGAAPRAGAEQVVARIWRETLSTDKVGRDDNFFDLGGHSLLAVQVGFRLQEAFGREVSMIDMFRYTTVAAQAGFLTRSPDGGGGGEGGDGGGGGGEVDGGGEAAERIARQRRLRREHRAAAKEGEERGEQRGLN